MATALEASTRRCVLLKSIQRDLCSSSNVVLGRVDKAVAMEPRMNETLTGLELRSTVTGDGQLRLELLDAAIDPPGPDEIVVKVEATPLNPSDLALLSVRPTWRRSRRGAPAASLARSSTSCSSSCSSCGRAAISPARSRCRQAARCCCRRGRGGVGELFLTRWGRKTVWRPLAKGVRSAASNLAQVARARQVGDAVRRLGRGDAGVHRRVAAAVNAFGGGFPIAKVGAVYLAASALAAAPRRPAASALSRPRWSPASPVWAWSPARPYRPC